MSKERIRDALILGAAMRLGAMISGAISSNLKQTKIYSTLTQSGVQVIADICWCSITEPILPSQARTIMTNSGKYAHYAYGLSGRYARLSNLRDCVEAAVSGIAPKTPPSWLER